MEQSRGRQPRVLKIVLMHSKGSVFDRYLGYIGLRGSETALCTEGHPLILSLRQRSKEGDGFGLDMYFECLFRLSQGPLCGGLKMEIEAEVGQERSGDEQSKGRKGDEGVWLDLGIY